ncbi:MAG: hypothetical protein ABWW69_01395 [Pyrodictiaceae archaeon]
MSNYPNATKNTNDIPKDIIEDIEAYEREYKLRGVYKYKKKPYPRSSDIAEAIRNILPAFYGGPDEFPEAVLDYLAKKNYYVGYVTIKRIWRIYEQLYLKGIIRDKLGVISPTHAKRNPRGKRP